MAVLYITEYAEQAIFPGGHALPAGKEPAVATQTVAISGSHAESSAFNAKTAFVRLHTDAICSVLTTAAGTAATTSHPRMAAGTTEYFAVEPGSSMKVSVISNT